MELLPHVNEPREWDLDAVRVRGKMYKSKRDEVDRTYPFFRSFCPFSTEPYIMAHNTSNLEEALFTRVFQQQTDDGEWGDVITPDDGVFTRLDDFGRRLQGLQLDPLPRRRMIDFAPPGKTELYRQAVESLEFDRLTKRDAEVTCFVKVEKYLKPTNPRVIQARSVRYHVEWGRFIIPIEKAIYRAVNRLFGYRVIMKGLNPSEMATAMRASWDAVDDPVAVMLDASRFDRHVSVDAHQWKHGIYRQFLNLLGREKKRFATLAAAQLCRRGKGVTSDSILTFDKLGGLCSGDMDTSLSACLIVCALFWTFMKEMGVSNYRFIDNGDDCVLVISRDRVSVLESLPQWMASFGFIYRVDGILNEFERIEFCQTFPIYSVSRGSWVCVRNPHKALVKDLVIAQSNRTWKEYLTILASIGDGGLASYGDMPIYWVFYRRLAEITAKRVRVTHLLPFTFRGSSTLPKVCGEPTHVMREQFAIATGIPVGDQLALEKFYESAPIGGVKVMADPGGWY